MNNIIGKTPMLKIKYKLNDTYKYFYAKLEYFNLTGSIKDRIVDFILKKVNLNNYSCLVEATSGNTGISLASFGALYKKKVVIFIPYFVSKERIQLLKLYGAKVILKSSYKKCVESALNYSKNNNGFLLNQFSNKLNTECHYKTTAREIIKKLIPDIFVTGIGTGGTLMGISKKIKKVNKKALIYALEPLNNSIVKSGKQGKHKIQGISDDFIPSILDKNIIYDFILVSDKDAFKMTQKLSKELGLSVGISSGANAIASIILNEKHNKKVFTIFADDSKKYLSTNLVKKIKTKNYFVNNVEFINYEVI